jgi:hypothetical protein
MSLSGQSSRFCDPCFCVRYPPTFDHAAGSQDVCQDSQQAHADRWRRLPPRSPPGTRLTGRSRPERTAHHGIKKRAPAHSRRSFKRKNGRFWRAQFCTEVARSERFELPTLGFEVRCSIQLSYERVPSFDYQTDRSEPIAAKPVPVTGNSSKRRARRRSNRSGQVIGGEDQKQGKRPPCAR